MAGKPTAALLVACMAFCAGTFCRADNLDTMGVRLLRAAQPALIGTGVRVAQPEALMSSNSYEVNPAMTRQPTNLFTWIDTNGVATDFTNEVGLESGHADQVGDLFYGTDNGIAPGVAHVDNYEGDYFADYIISSNLPITDEVVNQSFIFPTTVKTN